MLVCGWLAGWLVARPGKCLALQELIAKQFSAFLSFRLFCLSMYIPVLFIYVSALMVAKAFDRLLAEILNV
jgi:hypothetical protein